MKRGLGGFSHDHLFYFSQEEWAENCTYWRPFVQIVEMKLYVINLTKEEREELRRLTTTGRHCALKVLHARILLKADECLVDEQIAEHLNVSVRTVERVRKRCAIEGITAALHAKKRPPKEPKVDGEAEARLIQLGCSRGLPSPL